MTNPDHTPTPEPRRHNQLHKTFLLTLLVAAALLALFYLPRVTVGDTTLRRVNLLSDIQRRDSAGQICAEVSADRADGIERQTFDAAAVSVTALAYRDSVPEGMVAIEDFADSTGQRREMDPFYAALSESRRRPVRIAYFGDSFVEGDILTADLRDLLQMRFGGSGVGWVDITSQTAGFRTTVLHRFDSWAAHSANDPAGQHFDPQLQGINGRYFIPLGTATATYTAQRNVHPERLGRADRAILYYASSDPALNLSVSVDSRQSVAVSGSADMPENAAPQYDIVYVPTDSVDEYGDTVMAERRVARALPEAEADRSGSLLTYVCEGPLTRLNIKARGRGRFFGVAFEGKSGVVLDNFSMRGSSGTFLAKIPQATLRQYASRRPYDLIILHYGLNVAAPTVVRYAYYTDELRRAIDHIKAAMPGVPILVVSVSDRDQRDSTGELHTMRGVRELAAYQRRMAADAHVAFWDLYQAMGADGAMARLQAERKANLDYTHINARGGRHIAALLYEVLLNGKQNHDRRTSL